MEAPRVTTTRRAHRKSRLGCVQCKQRKIKCDETKPSCEKCIRYSTTCSFLSMQPASPHTIKGAQSPAISATSNGGSSSHPTPASLPTPNGLQIRPRAFDTFEMVDMELLHFYTMSTALTISDVELFQVIIPQIAYTNDFLMFGMLALSACHMAYVRPERRDYYIDISGQRLQTALALFQKPLSIINSQNIHACVSLSMILSIYTWASPDQPSSHFLANPKHSIDHHKAVELVQVFRGMMSVLRSNRELVFQGPLFPLFAPWFAASAQSVDLPEEYSIRLSNLAMLWEQPNPQVSAIQAEVLALTLKMLKRNYALLLSKDTSIDDVAVTLSWSVSVPDEFLEMVQDGKPQALVLLAHYCPMLKKIDDNWWIRGNAMHLLNTVAKELDVAWRRWIEWPTEELGLGIRGDETLGEQEIGR